MVRIHLGLPLSESDGRAGDVAQLVERLVCNQKVRGSIPLVSTISQKDKFVQVFRPVAADGWRQVGQALWQNGLVDT